MSSRVPRKIINDFGNIIYAISQSLRDGKHVQRQDNLGVENVNKRSESQGKSNAPQNTPTSAAVTHSPLSVSFVVDHQPFLPRMRRWLRQHRSVINCFPEYLEGVSDLVYVLFGMTLEYSRYLDV